MAWEEVVKRFGASEKAELNSAVDIALLQIADSAREQGHLEEAMKAVEQVFDRSKEQASSRRCEGYLIRAQASVAAEMYLEQKMISKKLLRSCRILDFSSARPLTY